MRRSAKKNWKKRRRGESRKIMTTDYNTMKRIVRINGG